MLGLNWCQLGLGMVGSWVVPWVLNRCGCGKVSGVGWPSEVWVEMGREQVLGLG